MAERERAVHDSTSTQEYGSMAGVVVAIYTSPARREKMRSLVGVSAHVNRGLTGDRYHLGTGKFSKTRIADSDRGITIIAAEAARQGNANLKWLGIDPFSFPDMRRNLVVEGISPGALNELVGQVFSIGEVDVVGVEQSPPCETPPLYLERPTKEWKAFVSAFEGMGGIRARVTGVTQSGLITIGSQLIVPTTPEVR